MQFFWGVFLADLQNHPAANRFIAERVRLCRLLSLTLLCSPSSRHDLNTTD